MSAPTAWRQALPSLLPRRFDSWVAARRHAAFRLGWRPDLSRDGMLLIGLVIGVGHAVGALFTPVDAVIYWNAGTTTDLYPEAWSEPGALVYPPPLAQLSAVLQPIGWPVFVVSLMVATFGAFWYCARRWSLPLVALGIPYFVGIPGPLAEIGATFLGYALLGNLQWILAALTIMAFRHPALYSVLLMTKLTVAVGWWWHVFREEWRPAAIGAGATLAVLLVSVIAGFELWVGFVGFVVRNLSLADPPLPLFAIPLWLRLPTAIALVTWGARTNRPWTVPVAAGWALPALYGFGLGFLPFWVAAWQLRRVNLAIIGGERVALTTRSRNVW
jgi:hypothetical protein